MKVLLNIKIMLTLIQRGVDLRRVVMMTAMRLTRIRILTRIAIVTEFVCIA